MPEIFSKRMDKVIAGLQGVAKSMDDFLIYAKDVPEHDRRLRLILSAMSDFGVTLNLEKCYFRQTEVEFLGHRISSAGVQPLREKLEAITSFPTPKNITELRSFMGFAQQMSRFSPKLSTAAEPLRDHLRSKNLWLWTPNHLQDFQKVKSVLSSTPVLAHYDISKPTKLRTDGSLLNGISVLVYQQHGADCKPIDCSSRFLSPAEKNYFPMELEILAVTWGCEKMSVYLQGLPHFSIQTDHKPLIPILNSKSLTELSPRIQRLRMRLLRYNFTAEYVPGKQLIDADTLSRDPVLQPTLPDQIAEKDVAFHVHAVLQQLPTTEHRIEVIKQATKDDHCLRQLMVMIQNGWPDSKQHCPVECQVYFQHRGDLTLLDGLILNGDRILIPSTLRKEVLHKIHEGHLGMEKCKKRARQTVFWPNMSNHNEQLVRQCDVCLKLLPSKSHDPLLSQPVATRGWQKVGTDLFTFGNRSYLIIADYYSLWPEVYLLKEPAAHCVIEATKEAFSHNGIAEEVISDNGPQYSSLKYKRFSKEWEFRHITSSPRYPRSNGLAESMVKSVKRLLNKCH